ncbi:response regulator [Methanothermobacter marburgensis]|uniref:Predicted sensory transduction histidine kinase n=1 Tax=Methanothermobacter marburgensis (strain ATCC BAA-927 / DSM 2133 / JCM 14651 / NBRC 100331 / OCM 82 / Marburg) TaxID=79929 RepID=D9PXD6_METTM|nr:histidine kinase dimerization/phosphoacceptor domain -containing protein [Methanothermobacter marburgensis]ADL58884.1 predicted sensory transduction histidine kinase [Methanothermobacter marburgensis str. Marburg]WBF09429.1 response regulator [Methanothermobacter marburgensis]
MTCRILILEDVPLDVELMEREISRSGIDFISETVEGEEDFVRALHEFNPDVILADHSLPSFDGLSALAIARKLCPDVPFIFVSGKIGEEFAVKALKSGATDYVLKSNFSKVPVAIRRALREVEKERELERTRRSLAESHWQLKEAQRIGKIGSWQWNFDSETLSCSDEALRILGIRKQDFGGTLHEMVSRIHPEDRESFIDSITKKEPFEGEYRVMRDESVAYVLFRAKVLYDSRGNPTSMIGIKQDITEDKNIRESLEASLREKEFLMSEIHHRVKNNLQLIISLLRLQSRYIYDEKSLEIFTECQNRVRSIALVHERFYGSRNGMAVNLSDYIEELLGELKGMCRGRDVVFRVNLAEIEVGINTAVSIGLIVNELVTNAIKHGTGDSGEIKVELESFKGSGVLMIADDGSGLPEDLDLSDPPGFGLRLVNFMLSRIKGSISAENQNGAVFRITFDLGG